MACLGEESMKGMQKFNKITVYLTQDPVPWKINSLTRPPAPLPLHIKQQVNFDDDRYGQIGAGLISKQDNMCLRPSLSTGGRDGQWLVFSATSQ